MSKRILKISLITITLMVCLACFRFSYASVSSAIDSIVSTLVEGLVGILLLGLQQLAVLLFTAIDLLTIVITGVTTNGKGLLDGVGVSLGDIVFNRCAITSANFFPEVWVGGSFKHGAAMAGLVENISKYYVIVRNLSIAILLGVLLYVGIRMAISTVASDEAKYKKMLYDWAISLVLVFMLHFIIIITFYINNQLVALLARFDPLSDPTEALKVEGQLLVEAMVPATGTDELIVYGAISIAKFTFALTYIKRTIVLGFLIVISPLITITYAIDKMGDGKSQALNTWLREFVFTVIIQPFHCLIYLVFYGPTIGAVAGISGMDMGKMIFAAASAFFMLKAEGIVKKIFGIQPSGIGDAIGTGAMALTAATGLFGKNKGKQIDKSKGKMPKMKNNIEKQDAKEGKNTEKDNERNARDGGVSSTRTGNSYNGSGDGSGSGSGSEVRSSGETSDVNMTSDSSNVNTGNAGESGAEARTASDNSSRERSSAGSRLISGATTIGKVGAGLIGGTAKFARKAVVGLHGGERAWNRNGGFKGYMSRSVSGAATLAGFIAGATVGDLKTAASVGTAAGSMGRNLQDSREYRRTEDQLEKNEEVFAGGYQDFEAALTAQRAAEGKETTQNDVMAEAKRIWEGGGQNLQYEWQKDFYNNMDNLSTSAEIMGYKDGFSYVKSSINKAQEGVIEPNKNYVPKDYSKKDNGEITREEAEERANRARREANRRNRTSGNSTMDSL